jgi:threonine/homoserine/homoserine lactone efflux protein
MVGFSSFAALGLIALASALTPGPNMIYLVSRSICQGRAAGFISLIGIASGSLVYIVCTSLGITSIIMALPYAYDALRLAGATYLLYLAWQALRPKRRAAFVVRNLSPDSNRKLFTMGLVTSVLNPKAAVFYLSLLPQFIDPSRGYVLLQSVLLGLTQIVVAVTTYSLLIAAAGIVATFLSGKSRWIVVQRWFMATVLGGLAVRMAIEAKK